MATDPEKEADAKPSAVPAPEVSPVVAAIVEASHVEAAPAEAVAVEPVAPSLAEPPPAPAEAVAVPAEPAPPPAPTAPASPAKEWGTAIVLMAVFAFICFAFISYLRN